MRNTMALKRVEKQGIIEEVLSRLEGATSVVAAQYSGMSVSDLTELRSTAREANVDVRVVKNTLARRAFQGTKHAEMVDVLQGQLILAFSNDGPGEAAKVFKKVGRNHQALKVVGISLGSGVISGSKLDMVAKLPNKEEAISTLMAVMQAPIGKLACTLNEVPGKLVRTVAAVKEAKEAA